MTMLVQISERQVHGGTVAVNEDGEYVTTAPLFGIVATELGARQAKQAARQSGSLGNLLTVKQQHTQIGIPAGTVIAEREPVEYNGKVYNAVHAGNVFLHVEDKALTVYESAAARKAAEQEARGN